MFICFTTCFTRLTKRTSFSGTWLFSLDTVRFHICPLETNHSAILMRVDTCYPFDSLSVTAAKSIQQAGRMWAGRAGRGVIGRCAASQWWRPTHSANERRAGRTRVRPRTGATLPAFQKKIPDSTFLGPPVFFCLAALSFGIVYRSPYPLCDGALGTQVEFSCSAIVDYGVVDAIGRGADRHRHKVQLLPVVRWFEIYEASVLARVMWRHGPLALATSWWWRVLRFQ